MTELRQIMLQLGQRARAASSVLASASSESKNRALSTTAEALRLNEVEILRSNEQDMRAAQTKNLSVDILDRLYLDEQRIKSIATALKEITSLPDPVGQDIASWQRPNGLKITRRRTPLGVIGIIYESRPNVTIDAGALCLKAGNASILRGGSESSHSARALHHCLQIGLEEAGLPHAAISLVPTTDRAAVGEMLQGLDGSIDVLIPRGGKSLVARVQQEARIAVIGHLDGICHLYIDGEADMAKAIAIAVNSKMRRTGICGATETILVDRAIVLHIMPTLGAALNEAGCEIRGDETIIAHYPPAQQATTEDWKTEYLAPIVSIAAVEGVTGAIDHINKFSSGHTESIVTENSVTAEIFQNKIDSAIVMHNASTQFADGGEFGMGAEIGIATGRIHARGPVGVEQLTTFKYIVSGSGQTRE